MGTIGRTLTGNNSNDNAVINTQFEMINKSISDLSDKLDRLRTELESKIDNVKAYTENQINALNATLVSDIIPLRGNMAGIISDISQVTSRLDSVETSAPIIDVPDFNYEQ